MKRLYETKTSSFLRLTRQIPEKKASTPNGRPEMFLQITAWEILEKLPWKWEVTKSFLSRLTGDDVFRMILRLLNGLNPRFLYQINEKLKWLKLKTKT